MRTFAILHEPASYTVDRNHRVYDPMGIHYAYMYGQSEAKSDEAIGERPLQAESIVKLTRRLNGILRHNDVVIVNGYAHRVFIILFILNLFYGRMLGIDSDTPLAVPSHPLKRWIKMLYLGLIFRNHHVCGLSGGTGSHKELFRHYGMKDERIFLMPMMVDNEKFYNPSKKAKAIPFVFLYVGRIIECKNLSVLLEAFSQTFGNNENVQLRIVGDGELLAGYKEKYSGAVNIAFLGKKYGEDLIREYHSADALVLPSSYEPWGLVVNEAMSAGVPVIVSNRVGATHDLVEGHDTGLIFKNDDACELAERMKRMATDTRLCQKFSVNAFRLMHDHWNYNLYTKCLKSFLDHVSEK